MFVTHKEIMKREFFFLKNKIITIRSFLLFVSNYLKNENLKKKNLKMTSNEKLIQVLFYFRKSILITAVLCKKVIFILVNKHKTILFFLKENTKQLIFLKINF